jgi:hypothetical protein
MPATIAKQCPGCGEVSRIEKFVYKMIRRVFSGSRCACGFERKWRPTDRRRPPKREPCPCECGHLLPCYYKPNKDGDYPKCSIPDCTSTSHPGIAASVKAAFEDMEGESWKR